MKPSNDVSEILGVLFGDEQSWEGAAFDPDVRLARNLSAKVGDTSGQNLTLGALVNETDTQKFTLSSSRHGLLIGVEANESLIKALLGLLAK